MRAGLIFDMDGTLWDTSRQVVASWAMAVEELGGKNDAFVLAHRRFSSAVSVENMRKNMGLPVIDIVKQLFPQLSEEERITLTTAFEESEVQYLRQNGGKLYDGVSNVLEQLSKQYVLCIVSNCPKGYIDAFIEHYEFQHYFSDYECYGNSNASKADNIRIIVERNGLDKYIYVGDTQQDYYSAVRAGAGFIHASYGFGSVSESVPSIVSFYELPDVVHATLTAGCQ